MSNKMDILSQIIAQNTRFLNEISEQRLPGPRTVPLDVIQEPQQLVFLPQSGNPKKDFKQKPISVEEYDEIQRSQQKPPQRKRFPKIVRKVNRDETDLMEQIRMSDYKILPVTPDEYVRQPPSKRQKQKQVEADQQKFSTKTSTQESLLENVKQNTKNDHKLKRVNSIRIVQINVQGALNDKKLPYINNLMTLHNPELLMINEFGIDKDHAVFPKIKSYHCVSFELKSTFSGVAIYAQTAIVDKVSLISTKHDMRMAQICGIQIKNMKLYNVYRSPNMPAAEEVKFVDWIQALDDSNVLIIGDLNLKVSWDDFSSEIPGHKMIANQFLESGFCQYQYGITYMSSGNTLDVTLSNNFETVMSCFTDPIFYSPAIDHVPTITDIILDVDIVEEKEIKLWKKRDKDRYREIVTEELSELMEYLDSKDELDLDEMDSRLADILLNAEDATIPKVTIKPRKIKQGGTNAMSEKTKRLYDIARSHRKAGRFVKANKMLAVVKDSLEKDRKNWQLFHINKLSKDRNHLWKIIKESTVSVGSSGPLQRPDGTLTFCGKEKVKLLSDRYESVLTPKTYPKCNPEEPSGCKPEFTFSRVEFSTKDIEMALKHCNNSNAKDSRGLSMPLFREILDVLSDYLATMFNLSLEEGRLAAIWLLAMVIPIPKGGDLTIPKQWRPVILEQSPLRILEAAFNWKLVNHLEFIGFFHKRQDGFRRGHSTIHNLLEFWNFVVDLMKRKGRCDVIYADTSAAFDRLSHGILLDKLYYDCGVYGQPWFWLRGWTTKRKQFVHWNSESSHQVEVTSSCMQGSCLGTTMWIIYFNEVAECLERWITELEITDCDFFIYADDLKICFYPSPENIWKINILLQRLQKKMDDLHLKFNALKCHVLTLGSIRNLRYDIMMKDEDGILKVLQRTTVERDLGLQVDSDGTFSTHIKKCIGVAKATAKIMNRIFRVADFITKVQIYESHIFSRLAYASEIYGNLDRKTLDEMNKIWIDHFKFCYVPANRYPPLLPEQAIKEKDLLMMFKIYNDKTPLKKEDYFKDSKSEPKTRSQAQKKLVVEKPNRWDSTTLVIRNRDVWNDIPIEIRECNDLERFQAYIRTEILEDTKRFPCQMFRIELMKGDLRRRSKENEKKTRDAIYYSNINKQLGIPSATRPDDFVLHEDFRDDFLKPDLCFKRMSKRASKKLDELTKVAPWMTLCLCDNPMCVQEVKDFEQEQKKELRDFPRVILKDDHIIRQMNNKQLILPLDEDGNEILNNLFYD